MGKLFRDLYILSRLNHAIKESNAQLEDYNFGGVTSTLHSFFLYDVSQASDYSLIRINYDLNDDV